jgi:hypothetical protein
MGHIIFGPVKPPSERKECRHRGEVIREELCQSCCGRVRIRVFACTMHVEMYDRPRDRSDSLLR